MFARFSAVFLFALPLLATAGIVTFTGGSEEHGGGNCSSDKELCCNSVHDSQDAEVAKIFSLIGIAAQGVTGQVGVTCVPVSALVGINGQSCSQQTVCCADNNYNGIVALGCTPVNANV
ncbi:hypothetical protein H0H92_012410 [Tricholoma furcatifolium]|nr:hypothetical protein H0H92_012410 [Tricholoma furcatifolium]